MNIAVIGQSVDMAHEDEEYLDDYLKLLGHNGDVVYGVDPYDEDIYKIYGNLQNSKEIHILYSSGYSDNNFIIGMILNSDLKDRIHIVRIEGDESFDPLYRILDKIRLANNARNKYIVLSIRMFDNGEESFSTMYYRDENSELKYNFILEDEYRAVKVFGETRVEANTYKFVMRKEGGKYKHYSTHPNKELAELVKKYGIPHIIDVPKFTWVLIHPGNDDGDTDACLLPGMTCNNFSYEKGFIGSSITAFIRLLRGIGHAVDNNKDLYITIKDMDRDIHNLI